MYYKVPSDKTFDHLLPSLNMRIELAPKVIGRLGLSKTIGRQNYNVYGLGFTGQTCQGGPTLCYQNTVSQFSCMVVSGTATIAGCSSGHGPERPSGGQR